MKVGRLHAIAAADYEILYNHPHEADKSRRRTLAWTVPVLERLGTTGRVLSVGCGNGVDVLTLRSVGVDALGVERHRVDGEAVDFVSVVTDTPWPFGDNEFDAVLLLEVIEHVGVDDGHARESLAAEIRRVTRPGGALVIATPNRRFPIDEHGEPIRIHSPFRNETLTVRELEALFGAEMVPLNAKGYWAFERLGRLSRPVSAIYDAVGRILAIRVLHGSPLNPHLFLAARL
jgi:SAM-dependent methyltransferase